MTIPLFVGIDVSSKENVVCCLTDEEEKRALCRFTVLNNRPGIMELQKRINQLVDKHSFDEIRFGLEHTGCYSTHAAIYLHRHLDFGCSNVKVYMFNPSLIKEYKKSHFLSAPKNDRLDAWYIAAKVRSGHLPHPFTWSEPMMALQRLTRTRYHLMKALVRESNFLMTNLYLKCSDYTLVFENKLSATSLAVMEEFESSETLAEISVDQLVEFLIQHGKNRFDDPQSVAKELQKAARSSYRLSKAMADSVNLAMASSIRVIRTIQEQIKSIKKAIEDHLKTIPQTLDSVPGIGPIFSSGILAEIGDIHQFASHKQLAKHAGIAWTENQSGNFTASQTRLIHSGNRYLRYYLMEAANSVRVHDPVFAEYYAKKKAEPKQFAHKRALALTARKLVRLVFHLLKTNQLYQPRGGNQQEIL
ncbi:IS110 family RNA-guided transposase [Candidatus Contubernalis alkaliaceticus]|uniref:IS110 family transposase n=1 Tax=Candidatus Contubernalis alkaliaceticus TaxID=338645 RepID=UPI001F4C3A19|nr:IS110 family transposase [Candidatus Contubernalis alkalaceticus]UNC92461.1 IS110 family transposase [Candidatus Contubernalis alkalaceticus]